MMGTDATTGGEFTGKGGFGGWTPRFNREEEGGIGHARSGSGRSQDARARSVWPRG